MATEMKRIMDRLNKIEKDISYIKDHMEDAVLSYDDIASIEEAEKDLKKGRTRKL